MIMSDTHRFAFIHIPKCAGSFVRAALAQFDQRAELYHHRGVSEHPELGHLDYAHIPLACLEQYFYGDFERLREYRSFALIRDPVERFPSSLHERLVHTSNFRLSEMTPDEMAREIDVVLELLSKVPPDQPILDPALIHFSRQSDYVKLNGCQIIDTVAPITKAQELLFEIGRIVGEDIRSIERVNQRLQYAHPVLSKIDLSIRKPIEENLPRWLWKTPFTVIKKSLIATRVLGTAPRNPLMSAPNYRDALKFIQVFYKNDIELYDNKIGR